ncbi:hypothetical protein SAMN04487968_11733 [Nocardioides terrae]|uniref:Uncharacterized protein n=1 Tax=Nocardioides terrae TaxID=574651 RepID=A0A1I1NI46_9ACTN|nr:hypothetical protein [Nocardioides terrae]SFC97207.1 hypothetical protein SAMN04487968_11733 [Nocardioides terrae]
MNRTDELDRLYGLLVALGENHAAAPEPDLMDAFAIVADRHQPTTLMLPQEQDNDTLMSLAARLLLHLAETATVLGEALDMYDAWTLVTSVIENRGKP